jgi:hypothetical protein
MATATTTDRPTRYRLTFSVQDGRTVQGHPAWRDVETVAEQAPGEDLAAAFDRAAVALGYNSFMHRRWEVAS